MLSRRGFFSKLLPVAAAPVAAQALTLHKPLDFIRVYRGWSIRWHGWKELPTQLVRVGLWTARPLHSPDYGPFWYSTTLGVVDQAHEGYVLRMGAEKGWPLLTEYLYHSDHDGRRFKALQVQLQANSLRILKEKLGVA